MISIILWVLLLALLLAAIHVLFAQTGLPESIKYIVILIVIVVAVAFLLNRAGVFI